MTSVFATFRLLLAKGLRRLNLPALRHCRIDRRARVLGGSQLTTVCMGRYSYCGYNCRMTDVTIGAFCSISDAVVVGGAEHPVRFVSTSPVFHEGRNCLGANFSKHAYPRGGHTQVGNDVWIGYGAMLKAGVTVGDGAVIGMGSVVTRDIPPYEIWAGNPARRIRARFDAQTAAGLARSEWWNRPEAEVRALAGSFDDPAGFLAREADG